MTLKANLTALILATLIAVPLLPNLVLAQNQNQNQTEPANATATTNTTTTERNVTVPVEPAQLPTFPETASNQTNQTQPATQQPATQQPGGAKTPDNATRVITLLDDAQIKIDEARNLIRAIQAQVAEANNQSSSSTNETGEIIQSANDSATDIIDVANETGNEEVINDIENITEDIEDAIEDSIESNENATSEDIENITEDAVEVIENATDTTENSTIEVAFDNAMIRLLSNLVSAQDYNQNLGQDDRDELKANLQDAIAELASDAADSLR
jgi:hypothetical protein